MHVLKRLLGWKLFWPTAPLPHRLDLVSLLVMLIRSCQ